MKPPDMKTFSLLHLAFISIVLTGYILSAPSVSAVLGLDKAENLATNQGLYIGGASGVVKKVILILLSLSAVLALAALIWAGFLYITSFTNEENVKKAKTVALYAIIGLIFMVVAFLIIQIIGNTFSLQLAP